MNPFHRKIVAVVALTVLAVAGLAGAAGAVSSAPTRADVPVLHLTTAQRQALQAQVDSHLKDYGNGTQIGINQISWQHGQLVLTLPLPGEIKARTVDQPITPNVADCAFTHACLWSDTNFNGSRLDKVNCSPTITLSAPFNSSTGSIQNNQTTNTQTILENGSGQILNASQAPSRINDTGVGSRFSARIWRVCP